MPDVVKWRRDFREHPEPGNRETPTVFGLHVFPLPFSEIQYLFGPLMASSDTFTITVKGKTHGAVLANLAVDCGAVAGVSRARADA